MTDKTSFSWKGLVDDLPTRMPLIDFAERLYITSRERTQIPIPYRRCVITPQGERSGWQIRTVKRGLRPACSQL